MSSAPTSLHAVPRPVAGMVNSFDGTPIAYDYYDHTSRSLVLVIPGFWRDRRHASMLALASHLHELGYRAAITDPRGHGDSGGTYGFNLYEHYDTAAVAEELLRKLPIESITIVALSYGASVAISTAARHKLPIASLLLISAVADFAKITPHINPFTMHRHIALSQALNTPNFAWQFLRSPKLQAIDDIREVHVPVCLVHVKNDWLIGHDHSLALYEAANEPKELHVIDIPGNYHADRIFSVAANEIDPLFVDFLRKYTPV
jgi:alpha-beta hydrolase superfamily lysophospholipase